MSQLNRGAVGESYTVPSHNDVWSRSRTMSLDCSPSLTTLQFTVIRCLLNSYFSLAVSVTVEDCWISDAFFSSCLWRELICLIKEYFGRRPRLTYLQSTVARPLFNSPVSLAVSVTVGHCSRTDATFGNPCSVYFCITFLMFACRESHCRTLQHVRREPHFFPIKSILQ